MATRLQSSVSSPHNITLQIRSPTGYLKATNVVVLEIWTIYKEVATYYAAGLSPPEDVTLMFTDDNWGNVQRLPNEAERNRSGGIGVRYMLFINIVF